MFNLTCQKVDHDDKDFARRADRKRYFFYDPSWLYTQLIYLIPNKKLLGIKH